MLISTPHTYCFLALPVALFVLALRVIVRMFNVFLLLTSQNINKMVIKEFVELVKKEIMIKRIKLIFHCNRQKFNKNTKTN